MLCSNRFPLRGSPSTCVLDTALVPLPSFLLLAGFTILFILKKSLGNNNSRPVPLKWIHFSYMALVAAAFGMTVLEIARLIAEHLGVGLLPVSSITLVIVFVLLWKEKRGRTLEVSLFLIMYWLLLTIFETIKSVRLSLLVMLNPNTTKTSKYPSSDQFLDNVVLLCLYFVFFCVECVTLVSIRRFQNPTNDFKV
ncbi:hypothetical protein BDZ94DRAFT_224493 [Collybia nuda]|uniref:ABC transporter TMD0 domain-containing protein n=1 Tax=Collybia nuda TaxID=64659 RepID=A0A9P5XVD8_9AGAR|nr:hypothetical protein BDZ94DRAFT_224493 [Collybia nuda]